MEEKASPQLETEQKISHYFDKWMLLTLIVVLGVFTMFCSYMGWEELAKSFGHDNSMVIGSLLGLLTGVGIGRSMKK